jgi:hypothetical protein
MFHRMVGAKQEANLEEFEDAREVVAALSEEYAAAESSDYVSRKSLGGCVVWEALLLPLLLSLLLLRWSVMGVHQLAWIHRAWSLRCVLAVLCACP